MAYSALYRQYRPQAFSELVGQEQVTTTLRHQIQSKRIAHAYLFSGTRGTGKTTVAKIFARAINCSNPQDGEPCEKCPSCLRGIDDNPDIIEIDAASNNGVNEMRDLREKVRFAPLESQYKVYILDEAHMITHDAFNALLKTLEEPPAHVVFILATTEPQRLPATILSRCQRFEFHRLRIDQIIDHLENILQEISVQIDPEGLKAIAHAAQGGMRDALSIADQCIGFCGNNITYQQVIDVLGSMDTEFLFEMAQSMLEGNSSKCMHLLDEVLQKGRDLTVFSNDLLQHFRYLMLLNNAGESVRDLVDCDDIVFAQYLAQSKANASAYYFRVVESLSKIESEMKWMNAPRILFESSLLRLCSPPEGKDLGALFERLDKLEKRIDETKEIIPLANIDTVAKTTAKQSRPSAETVDWEAPPEFSEVDSFLPEGTEVDASTVESGVSNESDASDANAVFNALKKKQPDAIQKLFTIYQWQANMLPGPVLELIAPPNCLPTLVKTLFDKSADLASSISDQYPGIRVSIRTKSETASPAKGSAPSPNSDAKKNDLFKDAAALFGAENIKRKN